MGFELMEIMFFLIFSLVIVFFIVNFARGIKMWNKNNNSPRLTVRARVVSKRTSYHRNISTDVSAHSQSYPSYYVTFEFESGDRLELCVHGTDFGLLVEGDEGNLTLQGRRYLGFERIY